MRRLIDLTGKLFGRWLVLSPAGRRYNQTQWRCKCTCGSKIEKDVCAANLRNGKSESCGCLRNERISKRLKGKPSWRRMGFGNAALRSCVGKYKRGAKSRGLSWNLTMEQAIALLSSQCHYCGAEPRPRKITKHMFGECLCTGIDRENNSIGYEPSNCVSCCTTCNRGKMMMTRSEFLSWIKRVHDHAIEQVVVA